MANIHEFDIAIISITAVSYLLIKNSWKVCVLYAHLIKYVPK